MGGEGRGKEREREEKRWREGLKYKMRLGEREWEKRDINREREGRELDLYRHICYVNIETCNQL